MQKRLLTRVPDAPDQRDKIVTSASVGTPVEISYRNHVPYIKDQGGEGSCTGHGITSHYEVMVRLHKSELPLSVDRHGIRLAPQFMYGQERIMDGDFDDDGGSSLRTGFQVMNQIGCCLEFSDPYSDKNCFVEPTPAMIAEAKQFRFDAYHRIPDVETAKSVLVSGYTFAIGIDLFEQFESDEAASNGLIRMPRGESIGGHCMHVVGASDSFKVYDQTGAFIVQNSWGPSWADGGFCYVPYTYLNALADTTDLWVGHFGRAW